MNAKDELIELLGAQADDIHPDELSYKARVYSELIARNKAIDNNEASYVTHDEAMKMFETNDNMAS